jgi:hypothetical protein
VGPAIRSLVDAGARLGTAYGSAHEQLIAEDTLNGHQLQVYLRQDPEGWTLIVRGTPPLDAIISLHADRYSLHTPLTAEGEAAFSEIPEAWLRMNIDLVVVLPAASP